MMTTKTSLAAAKTIRRRLLSTATALWSDDYGGDAEEVAVELAGLGLLTVRRGAGPGFDYRATVKTAAALAAFGPIGSPR